MKERNWVIYGYITRIYDTQYPVEAEGGIQSFTFKDVSMSHSDTVGV